MTPLRLAWLRFTRGGTGLRGAAVTVAVCCTGMLVLSALGLRMQRSVVTEALGALPTQTRFITVSFDGDRSTSDSARMMSSSVLQPIGDRPLRSYLSYRPMWDGTSATYQLAASAQLADEVTLVSGRLPAACSSTRCEVLQLSGGDVDTANLGLVVVGQARWREVPPLQRAIDPSAALLMTADPDAAAALVTMSAVAQSRLWAVALPTEQIAASPSAWLAQVAEAATRLGTADGRLVLAAPDSEVARAAVQAASVDRRLQGLSLALVALAAWAVTLAVRQRQDQVLQAALVVRQYRPDLRLPLLLDVAVPVTIGAAAAAVLGTLGSAALRLPAPAGTSWWAVGLCAIGCTAAGRSALPGRTRAWAAAAAVLALGGAAWLLQVWPTVIAAAAAAGLAATVMGALPWRRATPLRRAITANNRGGLAATTGVIALATASAVAALTQASMLEVNALDHARFASPLAVRVTALAQQPLAAISLVDYQAMGGSAYPVARLPSTARSGMLDAAAVQVMGIPSGALAELPDLRHQTGVTAAQWRQLEPVPVDVGVAAPISMLQLGVQGLDRNAVLSVWLTDGSMRTRSMQCAPDASGACTVMLPAPSTSVRILGIGITEDPGNRARREHAAGEGVHDVTAPQGAARVTGLPGQPAVTIDYDLASGPGYLPLRAAGKPPAAIVDPLTAAQAVDGLAVLRLSPATTITLQVAGIATRFPTAPPRFAIVGSGGLAGQLAATDPSLMVVPDVWLGGAINGTSASQVLAAGATVTSQADVLAAMAVASARSWTLRGIGLAVLVLLTVAGIAATGLADDIARRTPARPWLRIGTAAAHYRAAVVRSALWSSLTGSVIGVAIAAPVAAQVEARLATDVLGATAAPPLAASYPVMSASALAVLVVMLTVAVADRRTRTLMAVTP